MMNNENSNLPVTPPEELSTMMLNTSDKSVNIGSFSVIGRRNEQQDAIKADTDYDYIDNGKAICVLCDGMGGLSGGEKASGLCTSLIYDTFHSAEEFDSVPTFYKSVIFRADQEVSSLKNENGAPLGAGTTLTSVVIDGSQLYWAAVGDSRIYIIRGNEILCITQDHNYLKLLNEMVQRGEITQEEANNHPKKEALICYIGIGGIRYIDMNGKPFNLLSGDKIVLCSDGLYRSLSEEEIKLIVCSFPDNAQQAAEALTTYALSKNLRNQDNTSVVVIGYEDLG